MINILHIGSFNRNLGDNIALKNVQKSFLINKKDINFINLDISCFWNKKNDPEYVINKIKKYNADAIIFGGGGLIEYNSYTSMKTFQKLPLNKYIIKKIGVPIFLYGIGINTFRGNPNWPIHVKETLKEIFQNVTTCSFRNDGSIEKSKKFDIYIDKIIEIPDPGLLFHSPKSNFLSNKKGMFQPAINASKNINDNRFLSYKNFILNIPSKYNLEILPHTQKDFEFIGKYIIKREQFNECIQFHKILDTLDIYKNYDFIVCMRGHSQLVSIGMKIPGIYLSTQDKINDFSKKNNFIDYTVDVTEKNWISKFEDYIHKIKYDENYIKNWNNIAELKLNEWNILNQQFVKICLSYL